LSRTKPHASGLHHVVDDNHSSSLAERVEQARLLRAGFRGRRACEQEARRLSVSINGDGDMMYAPGVLWTMAHHHIPFKVMQNNRAYHQEYMHVQRMPTARAWITAPISHYIKDRTSTSPGRPGMGVYAEGPISDPKDLGPALKRAIEVVKPVSRPCSTP